MKPTFKLIGGGVDITDGVNDRLLEITVTDQQGYKSDRLEILLDDRDPVLEFPAKGEKMVCFMGYEASPGAEGRYNGKLVNMGTFIVDEVEYSINPCQIKIVCHGNDTGGTLKKSKTRSFDQKTIGDIAKQIAGEHGMQVKVGPELASVKIDHIDQTNQSDQGFLSDLGWKHDGVMKVVDGTILLGKKGTLKQLAGKGVSTVTVDYSDCASATFLVNARSDFTGAQAKFHDKKLAKEKTVLIGNADNLVNLDDIFATEDEAKAAAKSKKNAQDRAVETVSLTCVGDPMLMAEATMLLTGFRPGLRTSWMIKQAVHSITGSGTYSTNVDGELPEAAKGSVKGRASSTKGGGGGSGGAGEDETASDAEDIFDSKPDTN